MNGQELFEKLTNMTEDERKACQFWQLTDKAFFDESFDELKDEIKEAYCTSDEEMETVKNGITADDIAEVGRRAQNIEAEMEDTYANGFDETYKGKLRELVEHRVASL